MHDLGAFMSAILTYYGPFVNDLIAKSFTRYASKINPYEFNRIFTWMTENVSSNWKIDVKTLIDACKALGIQLMRPTATSCKVCGAVYASTICPVCQYNPFSGQNTDEYRKFWLDWKANPGKYQAEVAKILENLKEHNKEQIEALDTKNKKKKVKHEGH